MNHPDRKNTLALLGDWQTHHAAVEKLMDDIASSIGLDPSGPLFDTVWKLFDAYTDALAAEVGDFGGWLKWYAFENGMGEKAMAAGYDGVLNPVQTLGGLFLLIEESRNRESK